ncbi:hypothetical protein ACFOZ0_13740 [Streptomyces yaanensis]|uniref:Uncharacterized protein n=1 Tax=Streptomyces yaanensis TaxID=1142239 RepID=A0ABV7SG87_9ACTN|nr:hypothetical protein [Streptomyces sp. CGMCC 4.7035]WNB98841.1 hypothetical protein Q2K21_12570 [Streptomyces sp. CGMCC 4.7035]
MRLTVVPAVVVAGCVALGWSAPVATAVDDTDLIGTVSPSTARLGETVRLTLRNCGNPSEGGLAEGSLVGGESTARSPIGITNLEADASGALVGTATIVNAKPGERGTVFLACSSDMTKVAEVTVTIAP